MIERNVKKIIFDPGFGRQMRFLSGPRQSGKTTLAKTYLEEKGCPFLYYNWDLPEIRKSYRESSIFFQKDLYKDKGKEIPWVCFDEIHKIPKWKNILKGIFDEYQDSVHFIITGSARLEWFRKAGDSLAGRYFMFHLFPVCLCELTGGERKWIENPHRFIETILSSKAQSGGQFDLIYKFSGFPEPLLKGMENYHKLWRRNYKEILIKEDLRDLTNIKNIFNIEKLMDILPLRIGSPLSINSLKEEMEVNYSTVLGYIKTFELLYFLFHVTPYTKNINRALRKEKKYYLFDWTLIENESARFENYCAFELKTMIQEWEDQGIGEFSLCYIRNREGKETDFLILKDNKPWMLFECKVSDHNIASHHYLHSHKLGDIPFVQLVKDKDIFKIIERGFYIISANRFFG